MRTLLARGQAVGLTTLAGAVALAFATTAEARVGAPDCPSHLELGPAEAERVLRFYADPTDPSNHERWAALKLLVVDSQPAIRVQMHPAYPDEELSSSERALRVQLTQILFTQGPDETFAKTAIAGPQQVVARQSRAEPGETQYSARCLNRVLLRNLEAAEAGLELSGESVFPVFAIEHQNSSHPMDWFEASGDPRGRDVSVRLQARDDSLEAPRLEDHAHLTDFRNARGVPASSLRQALPSKVHPAIALGSRHHLAFVVDEHAEKRAVSRSLRPILDHIRAHPGQLSLQLFLPNEGRALASWRQQSCAAIDAGSVPRLFAAWTEPSFFLDLEPTGELSSDCDDGSLDVENQVPRAGSRQSGGGRAWLDARPVGPLDLDELDLVIAAIERQQSAFRLLWLNPLSSIERTSVPR